MTIDATRDLVRLIDSCARGDALALRDLYELEAPMLRAVAMRIVRTPEAADDVLQDAFVRIWRSAATFDSRRGVPRAWMVAIVRNRSLNWLRDRRREMPLDEAAHAETPDDAPDPLAMLTRMGESSALRRCLEGLEMAKRKAILLAFVDGCSHVEIARRLAEPLGTVKSWIRRGLAALKGCLA